MKASVATALVTSSLLVSMPAHCEDGLELHLVGGGEVSGTLESINFRPLGTNAVHMFINGQLQKPERERGKGIRCSLTIEGEVASAVALYNAILQNQGSNPGTKVFCKAENTLNLINNGSTYLAIVKIAAREKDSQGEFNIITNLK